MPTKKEKIISSEVGCWHCEKEFRFGLLAGRGRVYEEGFDQGYEEGYKEGYEDGYAHGRGDEHWATDTSGEI